LQQSASFNLVVVQNALILRDGFRHPPAPSSAFAPAHSERSVEVRLSRPASPAPFSGPGSPLFFVRLIDDFLVVLVVRMEAPLRSRRTRARAAEMMVRWWSGVVTE
jgi:hypothetical protein